MTFQITDASRNRTLFSGFVSNWLFQSEVGSEGGHVLRDNGRLPVPYYFPPTSELVAQQERERGGFAAKLFLVGYKYQGAPASNEPPIPPPNRFFYVYKVPLFEGARRASVLVEQSSRFVLTQISIAYSINERLRVFSDDGGGFCDLRIRDSRASRDLVLFRQRLCGQNDKRMALILAAGEGDPIQFCVGDHSEPFAGVWLLPGERIQWDANVPKSAIYARAGRG